LDAQSTVHAAERYQLHQRQLFLTQPDEELLERLFPTKGLGDDSDDDDDDDDNIKLEGDDPDAHSEFDDDRHSSMSRRTNTDSRAQRQRPELIEMAPRARRRNRVKLPEIGGERPESSISITSIDIAAKSPEHFQQNFIQRNREVWICH
jgi:hypothetical protein